VSGGRNEGLEQASARSKLTPRTSNRARPLGSCNFRSEITVQREAAVRCHPNLDRLDLERGRGV